MPSAEDARCRSSIKVLDELCERRSTRHLKADSYPSIASIPRTSSSRLECASAGIVDANGFDAPRPAATDPRQPSDCAAAGDSMLYLAYGSNLCAQTFLGRRGIRPISQVNVLAPTLELVFDLAGMPYTEPCFANTAIRKIPKVPKKPPFNPPTKLPPDFAPPFHTPPEAPTERDAIASTGSAGGPEPVWDKGLIGVVYEVTSADYAHILATEGGGSSYADILVACLPLPGPKPPSIPEKPPQFPPEIPRPFFAHTLFAPRLPPTDPPKPPSKPPSGPPPREPKDPKEPPEGPPTLLGEDDGHSGDGDGDGDDDDDHGWGEWKRYFRLLVFYLLRPVQRPDPLYAQPSERYLSRITTGAAEHDLPPEYQTYLSSLRPYRATTRRQKIGGWITQAMLVPFLMAMIVLGRGVADKKSGRLPVWVAVVIGGLFKLVWGMYDAVGKKLFGDGERTVEGGEDEEGRVRGARCGMRRWWTEGQRRECIDEEKRPLMDGKRN